MKKFKYLIFSICLFFFMIFSANAKEVNFSGNKIEIDDTTYPYFFIINSTDSNFDYYVFLLTNDQKDDFFLNSKGTTTYNFQTKSGNSVRYCKYKGSTSTSCSNSWYIDIKTNEVHYISNFDIKNKSGSIAFAKNYLETQGLGKFPLEINNFPINKIGKGNEVYNGIYKSVKQYINDHSNECKYYYIMGGWETYNDENGTFPSISLNCFDNNTKFNACPMKFDDGSTSVGIYANNNNRYSYTFGSNNYIYDSSWDKNYQFISYSTSSNKLVFLNEETVEDDNYYFETNLDKLGFSCSNVPSYISAKFYDSIFYKGKEYKVGGTNTIDISSNIPSISSKLINEIKNEFDKIVSQTYSFTWSIYDTTNFDYYFSSDGNNYGVSNSKDLELTFVENGTIYFKVTNKNESDVLYFYKFTINDINQNKTDSSLNQEDYYFGNLIDDDKKDINDSLDNDSTIAQIFQWFKDQFSWLIDNKFGIIRQFSLLYNTYKDLDISSYGDNRFFYSSPADTYFGCSYGVDPNNYGDIKCMHLNLSNLKFLKNFNFKDEDIYIFNFSTEEMKNLFWLFRTFVSLVIGSYTFIKCYRLVVRFLDNFNLGGV